MRRRLNTFRGGFIDSAGVPPEKRAQVIEDVRALLRPVLADEAGNWVADYVRIRFAARLPSARDSERATMKE